MVNKRFKMMIAVLLLLAAGLSLVSCGATSQAQPTEGPAVAAIAAETPEPTPTPTPAPTPEPTPTPTPEPTPFVGPDLPVQPRVGDGFFADAAFFGNSLIGGLKLYGRLDSAAFFGMTSAAVYNVSTTLNSVLSDGTEATMLDALCEQPHGKIYVLLGINEISFTPEYFCSQYSKMLDVIAERQPQAALYILSLTPVTREKSEDESVFTQERVLQYNEALHALAAQRGCYYVDLVEALAGPDGYLPQEMSTDGIHLTREYYPQWGEYLRTHYAPGPAAAEFVEPLE